MEQTSIIETFETSFVTNIFVEKYNVMVFLMDCIIAIYVQFNLIMFLEFLLASFLFTGIFMLGFIGITAHIRYYFYFERHRTVELYVDRMVILIKNDVLIELFKKDIVKIRLCDKLKYKSNSRGYNLWPTFADPFYYLIVIDKNQQSVILTCLLDTKLKKKIAAWYGEELEHKFQFFPFPSNQNS